MTLTNSFTLSGETVVVGVVKRGTINVATKLKSVDTDTQVNLQ